jgi:hypothetical protein
MRFNDNQTQTEAELPAVGVPEGFAPFLRDPLFRVINQFFF